MAKRDTKIVEGVLPYPVIAVITCGIGYVGCDNTEVLLLDAGTNVDNLCWEMAQEHAQSYSESYEYHCDNCGSESDCSEDSCNECGGEITSTLSEGVEGHATLFQLGRIGSTYASKKDIIDMLLELEAVSFDTSTGVIEVISPKLLMQSIDYDPDEWAYFKQAVIYDTAQDKRAAKRKEPKEFGGHSNGSGYTLAGLLDTCQVCSEAECGMDAALADGDLAASEHVIRDLVNYIYKLHARLNIRPEGHNDA